MKYLRLLVTVAAAMVVIVLAFHHTDTAPLSISEPKINGISFVAPVRPIDRQAMRPIINVNANWVAIIPYAFGRAGSSELRFNVSRQWWGEREEGVIKTIKHAKELGLKVLLKPHVWVRGQGWAGDFELKSEADWQKWETNYRDYIISYARLADSADVDLFCIGTEYRKVVVQRSDFWRNLTEKVRTIFKGKITYAANWDNYQNIDFWDDLDYIGVDAYFPLSEQKNPAVAHLKEKWEPIKKQLRNFATQQKSPILFTEFGYESVDYTAHSHWEYERNERALNLQAQANGYQALFETFWEEPWFAGGFLWKWFDRHPERGGAFDKRYTPQNKPAEETIRRWYGRGNTSDK